VSSEVTRPIPEHASDGERAESASPVSPASGAAVPSAGLRLDRYDNSDFDRGAGRIKEGLWVLCKCVFFLNPFPWPSVLRTGLLRIFGARIGRGVVIRSGAHITFPWRLTLGDHVWIGEEVLILSLAPVIVGSNVCISQRAFLCTGSHAWRRETFDLQTRPIMVGDSVWISAQAFIGRGVEIGNGSVIGAGSVLMKSVPENSLARGNPATVVPKVFL
jgi:putative colanic acid biosynthesis acetyltransferase WcaF